MCSCWQLNVRLRKASREAKLPGPPWKGPLRERSASLFIGLLYNCDHIKMGSCVWVPFGFQSHKFSCIIHYCGPVTFGKHCYSNRGQTPVSCPLCYVKVARVLPTLHLSWRQQNNPTQYWNPEAAGGNEGAHSGWPNQCLKGEEAMAIFTWGKCPYKVLAALKK